MKRLILLTILLIATTLTYAQTYNFHTDGNKVYWQKIFESNTDILALLTNSGKFDDIKEIDGVISCRLIPQQVELHGRSRGSMPGYLTLCNITAFVRIQKKEDRYRVTVNEITFITNTTTNLIHHGEYINIERYALKRDGTLKPMFLEPGAQVLNKMFTVLFTQQNTLDNNW